MANIDPVAQTFFVDTQKYPKGMFVDSIDLCFKKKDTVTYLPFTLQLRPTVNGYPHSTTIYPFGEVVKQSLEINTVSGTDGDVPTFNDNTKYTRFKFAAPVYLQPGEHAIVLYTNSDSYSVYIAELGKTRLDGSDRLISEQPYAGAFFKSQNGSTYTPYQELDLMFRLNRCKFTTGTTVLQLDSSAAEANTVYDLRKITTQELVFKDTDILYFDKATSNTTGAFDADFADATVGENYYLNERKVLTANNGAYVLKTEFITSDDTVSPVIDIERVSIVAIENVIDNAEIHPGDIVITNPGSGFSGNASITITSSKGFGANAYAVANTTTGEIVDIKVDAPGLGYVDDITATVTGGGGTGATVRVANEIAARGGNAKARYITRRVVLQDGFDANVLRVYFSAYNPAQTNIEVYYKVLAAEDGDNFDDRPYVRMQCVQSGNETLPNTIKSKYVGDYREYLYLPFTQDCQYVGSNNATYDTFKAFAIKIVMTTSDPTFVPLIKDFRTLALAP
jgi:hypothetical protein